MIDMLQYGSPSLATREAFNEAWKLWIEAQATWTADKNFFNLLQAVREKPEFDFLDAKSKHLLDRELLGYKHAGYGVLSEPELENHAKQNMKNCRFGTRIPAECRM
jgi:Zn-dependent oligopeptidases